MPTSPAKMCTTPRCPRRVEPNAWGLSKCAQHAAATAKHYRNIETRSPETKRANKRLYGRDWHRIRRSVLNSYPYCEMCGAPATEVDHILPLRQGGTHDPTNLRPLCKSCHSRRTATDQARDRRGH